MGIETPAAGLAHGLLHQAGLADAGIAAKMDRKSLLAGCRDLGQRRQLLQLGGPADEGAAVTGGQAVGPPQPLRRGKALELGAGDLAGFEASGQGAAQAVCHHRLAWPGQAGEAGGQVDAFAGDGTVGQDPARGDADVGGQRRSIVQRLEAGMNGKRRLQRPFGLVAVGLGHAEKRHGAVADVLVDVAAVAHQGLVGQPEKALQQGPQILGIQSRAELGKAREIGEQYRHVAQLRAGRGRLRGAEVKLLDHPGRGLLVVHGEAEVDLGHRGC